MRPKPPTMPGRPVQPVMPNPGKPGRPGKVKPSMPIGLPTPKKPKSPPSGITFLNPPKKSAPREKVAIYDTKGQRIKDRKPVLFGAKGMSKGGMVKKGKK
jgi:hypothetical protein